MGWSTRPRWSPALDTPRREPIRAANAGRRPVRRVKRPRRSAAGTTVAETAETAAKTAIRPKINGEGGIRTPGIQKDTPVFKTGSLNHSDTSPRAIADAHAGRRRPASLRTRPGPTSQHTARGWAVKPGRRLHDHAESLDSLRSGGCPNFPHILTDSRAAGRLSATGTDRILAASAWPGQAVDCRQQRRPKPGDDRAARASRLPWAASTPTSTRGPGGRRPRTRPSTG